MLSVRAKITVSGGAWLKAGVQTNARNLFRRALIDLYIGGNWPVELSRVVNSSLDRG